MLPWMADDWSISTIQNGDLSLNFNQTLKDLNRDWCKREAKRSEEEESRGVWEELQRDFLKDLINDYTLKL